MTQKTCIKCGHIKLLPEFYKDRKMRDGYRSECKECHKAYCKKYVEENSDKIRKYLKSWNIENAEYKYEYAKRWRQENPERYCESKRKWRQLNPERHKIITRKRDSKRRANKKNNGVFKVTTKDTRKLYQKNCVFCGDHENIEIDHVIPIAKGGVHGIGNLQPLCKVCNSKKSDNYMMQFKMESYG